MTTRTAVDTDDREPIRKARLAWIASTLRLPAARVRQMSRQAGSLLHRSVLVAQRPTSQED